MQTKQNHKKDHVHAFAQRFLPDLHHLPEHGVAKNALFFLALFGFGTMFLSQASASVSINTSLDNNIMTIQALRVSNGGPIAKIEMSYASGIKLDIGTPSGVLKLDSNQYITQGLIGGTDIINQAIDASKIQNNTITSTQIASGTITATEIAANTITCDKLNIPGFTCNSNATGATTSCGAGQYMQGITSTGVAICTTGSVATTLPNCNTGEMLIFSGSSWQCVGNLLGSPNSGNSLWSKQSALSNNIYNNNLTGNVGVGLNNPQSTLHVKGTFRVQSGCPGGATSCNELYTYTYSNAGTGSSCSATIYYPTNQAAVTATGYFTGVNMGPNCMITPCVGNPPFASCSAPQYYSLTSTSNATVLYVGTSSVGVLTNNPQYALDVRGIVRATQVLTTSDERLKSNIMQIPNALESILSIHGYVYTLDFDNSTQYGVIAQEVANFFPALVDTDAKGMKAVNYNGLIAPMIESIHTLHQQIQEVADKTKQNEVRLQKLESAN